MPKIIGGQPLYDYEQEIRIYAPGGRDLKITVIGGGHGQSTVLRGLKNYTSDLTGIVAVSDDGVAYEDVATQEYEIEGKYDPDTIADRTLSFPETSARYLKITVSPVPANPEWHYAPGRSTFVFIDEIIVD